METKVAPQLAAMENTQNTKMTTSLNTNETAVLECIQTKAMQDTGGEFTYFEDVMKGTWIGSIMTPAQLKGYLSQLQKKGFLMVEDGSSSPKQIFNIYYS